MLPYMEESALYDQLDLNLSAGQQPNAGLSTKEVPGFLCPTDLEYGRNGNVWGPGGPGNNYLCSTGPNLSYNFNLPRPVQRGFFNMDRSIDFKDILDGTSQVIAMVERNVGDSNNFEYDREGDARNPGQNRLNVFVNYFMPTLAQLQTLDNACPDMTTATPSGGNHYSTLGQTWMRPSNGWIMASTSQTPNGDIDDCIGAGGLTDGTGLVTARSRHSGGVQVVMGDGRVLFLGDSIDLVTYQRLGAIDDGEPLGEY